MAAQYKPNTPAVRALFRSIRMADMKGLKQALAQGADSNALYGKAEQPHHLPLEKGPVVPWP